MAKKSPKKKKTPASGPITENLKKMAAALMILAAITFLGAVLLRIFLEPSQPVVSTKKTPPPKESIVKEPQPEKTAIRKPESEKEPDDEESLEFEIYSEDTIKEDKPGTDQIPPGDHTPKIAIIIDDIGNDRQIAEKFMDIGVNLTFAILPYGTYHKSLAARANARGFEVMLHMPMEPNEYPKVKPGRSAIMAGMAPDTVINRMNENMDEVPYIKGINNHMGSRITSNSTQMYQVFTAIKKKDLYFIDSRTTSNTICKPSARLFRIPFAERDVFLDHVQTEAAIEAQLKKLVIMAKAKGQAVGIGHPHEETYAVLKKMLPELGKEVSFVHASGVVKVPN